MATTPTTVPLAVFRLLAPVLVLVPVTAATAPALAALLLALCLVALPLGYLAHPDEPAAA